MVGASIISTRCAIATSHCATTVHNFSVSQVSVCQDQRSHRVVYNMSLHVSVCAYYVLASACVCIIYSYYFTFNQYLHQPATWCAIMCTRKTSAPVWHQSTSWSVLEPLLCNCIGQKESGYIRLLFCRLTKKHTSQFLIGMAHSKPQRVPV